MSRVVNLKTVRFQIFNVLDSWHTNWADDVHYGHLLYEDLGIRSYFVGIFYRLRMPTNYLYVHRMSGNTLMLNTDVYFYKPFKKTKLRRYFVEQRFYINYLLKSYLYLVPHFFSLFNHSFSLKHKKRKRVSFFDIVKLHQFNSMGYLGLRKKTGTTLGDSVISYYQFSNLYSTNFLFSTKIFSSYGFFVRKKAKSRLSSLLSILGNCLTRFFYLSVLNGSHTSSFLHFVKYFQYGLFSKYFLVNSSIRQKSLNSYSNLLSYFSFFKDRYFRRRTNHKLKNNIFFATTSDYLNVFSILQRLLRFIPTYLKQRRIRPNHESFVKLFYRTRRKLKTIFSFWFVYLLRKVIVSFLFKLLVNLSRLGKRSFKLFRLYKFIFKFVHLINTQRFVISSIYRSRTPAVLNRNSNRMSFLNFFSRIKNIHNIYYRGKRATANRLQIPKQFKYTHVYNRFLKIFFSYFFNHIETVISNYTKQQVYCLYNLFYMGNKYYPPILNAKVLCDYFIYMIHGRKSIRGAFYKVRQWQLANIQRRLSLESMYFKTQMKRSPLRYLNHLSTKKYPIMGIRIECSGNLKKGTMARKFFYGDVIKNVSIVQKSPNNTFSADLDYYQSFALTKSASIGVKVWVLFKTHLYNSHGSIKTLVVY